MTFIAELDPRGWICRLLQYQHTILEHLMTHVFDVRDHLDSDRFVQAHFDPIVGRPQSRTAPAGAREGDGKGGAPAPVSLATDPALAPDTWGESEGSTFKVRGKTYNRYFTALPIYIHTCLFVCLLLASCSAPNPNPNPPRMAVLT